MEKKSFWWWVAFVTLTIWQLPQAILGAFMLLFTQKNKLIAQRHFDFCFEGEHMSGGISLGPIAIVSKNLSRHEPSVMHELDGHTVDSKIFGPLYLIIIGLPSIMNAIFSFTKCYYDFYTEKWANKHAKLIVENCRLIKKTL